MKKINLKVIMPVALALCLVVGSVPMMAEAKGHSENQNTKSKVEKEISETPKVETPKAVSGSAITVQFTLNKSVATIKVGDELKLKGTVKFKKGNGKKAKWEKSNNANITWVSSDTTVATVSKKGTVIGVSEGTVTITATTKNGKYIATSTITVEPAEVQEDVVSSTTSSETDIPVSTNEQVNESTN